MKAQHVLPLVLASLSIVIFTAMIAQHESHLHNNPSIYVPLAPVDPRSILQGDYMQLNYHFDFTHAESEQAFKQKATVLSYAQLDAQQRVIKMAFHAQDLAQHLPQDVAQDQKIVPLLLKNPNNRLESLYAAANSFMFAEGLEPCYRNARFAELRVNAQGKAMLASLVGENLVPLNCETQQQWRDG